MKPAEQLENAIGELSAATSTFTGMDCQLYDGMQPVIDAIGAIQTALHALQDMTKCQARQITTAALVEDIQAAIQCCPDTGYKDGATSALAELVRRTNIHP